MRDRDGDVKTEAKLIGLSRWAQTNHRHRELSPAGGRQDTAKLEGGKNPREKSHVQGPERDIPEQKGSL